MPDVFGAAPGGTTSPWNHTFIQTNLQLPPGAVITHLALHNQAPTSARPKIVRHVSGGQYEVVRNEPMFAHSGGGYAWAELATPFQVPASGAYFPAWFVNGAISRSVEQTPRGSKDGDVAGTVSFHIDTAGLPPMGYRTQDGGTSPPPPPPPEQDPHYIFLIGAAQSNGLALGQGTGNAAFCNRFLELVGHACTVQLVNAAVGSSRVADWQPGGAYFNNAVAMVNAALAQPGAVLAGAIQFIGEGDSSEQALADIFTAQSRRIHAGLRTAFGPALPIIMLEQFADPLDGRPWWADIQRQQREMGWHMVSGVWVRRPGYFFTTAADLAGGNLHPPAPVLEEIGRRLADVAAEVVVQP